MAGNGASSVISGALAGTGQPDIAAIAAGVAWNAVLAATGFPDSAGGTGNVAWEAVLSASGPDDLAAANGAAIWEVVIAATGQADTATATGEISGAGIFGSLSAAQPLDIPSIILLYYGLAEMQQPPDIAVILAYSQQIVVRSPPPATTNPFENLDEYIAGIISDEFASGVIWHPMIVSGNVYTNSDVIPDPNRPIVSGLTAIATWKPLVMSPGSTDSMQGTDRGALSTFDVSLDFSVSDFEDPNFPGNFDMPRKGDIFELVEEYEGNRYVELKLSGDDGGKRVIFYASAVAARELV